MFWLHRHVESECIISDVTYTDYELINEACSAAAVGLQPNNVFLLEPPTFCPTVNLKKEKTGNYM